MYIPRHRRPLLSLAFLLLLASTGAFLYLTWRPPYELYARITDAEARSAVEAHPPEEARGEGRRYVKFKQLRGAGFNNQVQEILLLHHLAHQTNRTYAYYPLVWRSRSEHSYVPLSAFLRGATEDAIPEAHFDAVCSEQETHRARVWAGGTTFGGAWEHARRLLEGQERCVVVEDWLTNWNFLASPAVDGIWPEFKQYLHKHFAWSDKTYAIAARAFTALNLRSSPDDTIGEPYIAIHLRRGDFADHCDSLASLQKQFTTWARLSFLAPSILPPALLPSSAPSVLSHCYPSLPRLLSSLRAYASQHPDVKTLFIAHDASWQRPHVYPFIWELAASAKKEGLFERVVHSAEVPIRRGEWDWGPAVDMEIARWAEAFVGNGYSSLTSQVIALRLGADGGRREDTGLY